MNLWYKLASNKYRLKAEGIEKSNKPNWSAELCPVRALSALQ